MIKLTVTDHRGDTVEVTSSAMNMRESLILAVKGGYYTEGEYTMIDEMIVRVEENKTEGIIVLPATDLAESCTIEINWIEETV